MIELLKKPLRGSRETDADDDDDLALELDADAEEESSEPTQKRSAGQQWWRRLTTPPKKQKKGKKGKKTPPQPGGHGWTYGSSLATQGVTWAAAAAIACGPLALGYELLHGDPPPAHTGIDKRMMSRQMAATDVASRWVRTWLSTDKAHAAQLQQWTSIDAQATDLLPKQAPAVGQVDVRNATPSGPGTWVITVAAQVYPDGKLEGSSNTRFFAVPVAVQGEATVAARVLGLPAEVPAPSMGVKRELDYSGDIGPGSGPWGTVSGFLNAMLAGQGDVTRYTSPGAGITAVQPTRWQSTKLLTLNSATDVPLTAPKDGTHVQVLADVQVNGAGASTTPQKTPTSVPSAAQGQLPGPYVLQYQITLTARAGRWEVSGMQTPKANNPGPTATPSSTK